MKKEINIRLAGFQSCLFVKLIKYMFIYFWVENLIKNNDNIC